MQVYIVQCSWSRVPWSLHGHNKAIMKCEVSWGMNYHTSTTYWTGCSRYGIMSYDMIQMMKGVHVSR